MMQVPYVDFRRQYREYREAILAATDKVLGHGQFILGQEVEELENSLQNYLDCRYVVGVGNGTDALYLALKSIGVSEGDEVITVSNSYLASVSSICLTGAKPVLVDVGDDLNVDVSQIDAAISRHTKAIIVVHLTGRPADMTAIQAIVGHRSIYIIEDAAQAIGAIYRNRKVGTVGDMGSFSLHPLKNLGCIGDGGIISTNNSKVAEYCRIARTHGHSSREQCEFWSHNMRLDALQAAFVNCRLPFLDTINGSRREHAQRYRDTLKGVRGIALPAEETQDMVAVYHTFIITSPHRDSLQSHLAEQGIDTKIHYPVPTHLLNSAQDLGYEVGSLPKTEELSRQILSLPIAEYLTSGEIDYVCAKIIEWSSRL